MLLQVNLLRTTKTARMILKIGTSIAAGDFDEIGWSTQLTTRLVGEHSDLNETKSEGGGGGGGYFILVQHTENKGYHTEQTIKHWKNNENVFQCLFFFTI